MQNFKLIQDDTAMMIQPKVIEALGIRLAQFLNQLKYWSEKQNVGVTHDGKKWIYNTQKQWAEQLKISVTQFKRNISKLKKLGLILVKKLAPNKYNRTNYIALCNDAINTFFKQDTSQTHSFTHETILVSSTDQNGLINIDSKTTNKNFNKSDENFEKPQKNSTAQDMLNIWNKYFEKKAPAVITKELAPLLVSAFKTKFDSCLEMWKLYCEDIKSSSYLMSDAFKLTLEWVLKFRIIDRIERGELGVRIQTAKNNKPLEMTISQAKLNQAIDALDETPKAKEIRKKIAKVVGTPVYASWFHQCNFVEINGNISLSTPNDFVREYLFNNYPQFCSPVE